MNGNEGSPTLKIGGFSRSKSGMLNLNTAGMQTFHLCEASFGKQDLSPNKQYALEMHKETALYMHLDMEHWQKFVARLPSQSIGNYSSGEADSLPKSTVSRPGYTAPELLQGTFAEGDLSGHNGSPLDVWQSGLLLYHMLFGCNPFQVSYLLKPISRTSACT